jgi:hypothetical protein
MVGSYWGHPRDIHIKSPKNGVQKIVSFFPSDEKKIVFILSIIQSKEARTLNLSLVLADWIYLCARFFWKIAIAKSFFFR